MKILITGARGFVGARLMKELEGAIAAPSIQGMNQEKSGRVLLCKCTSSGLSGKRIRRKKADLFQF